MELGIDIGKILRLKLIERIGIALALALVVAVAYWYFLLSDHLVTIETLENGNVELSNKIKTKEKLLADLPKMREELELLKIKEAEAMQVLPSSKDIPTLLTDISRAGHDQGLDFNLFAPLAEIPMQFYANVPVDISVQGTYHDLAMFMERIANFSRIVTISDISLTAGSANKNNKMIMNPLAMSARVTTYRFTDQAKGGKAK